MPKRNVEETELSAESAFQVERCAFMRVRLARRPDILKRVPPARRPKGQDRTRNTERGREDYLKTIYIGVQGSFGADAKKSNLKREFLTRLSATPP